MHGGVTRAIPSSNKATFGLEGSKTSLKGPQEPSRSVPTPNDFPLPWAPGGLPNPLQTPLRAIRFD